MSRHNARHIRSILRRFRRDEQGSMIVFTLFLIIMMLVMGGIAVDMMRFENNRTRLQGALDRAVLAAANLDVCLDPQGDPEGVVRDYLARSGFAGQTGDITVNRGFNSCEVRADAILGVNTIFMPWVGVDDLVTPASSAATESIDDVEVSLVLDVSGSMGRDGRIEALRDAGADFVETILESIEDGHATISVVPYSTQVNLGPNLLSQFLTNHNHTYSFCLDMPSWLYGRTDMPLATRYDQSAHFDADSSYNSSMIRPASRWTCNPDPNAWILPFSDDVGDLQAHIRNLTPNEWTSIEMGAKWGIAMLDPAFRPATAGLVADGDVEAQYAVRPLDFQSDRVLKFLVLMTDGENTRDYVLNTSYRGQNSDVWFQNRSGANDRWFVGDEESNDYDRDGRWREDYWVADTYPSSSEFWQNLSSQELNGDGTMVLQRQSWQDIWAAMPVREQAYHFRYDQYNNASTYYSWYDDLVAITYQDEKDERLDRVCDAAKDEGIVIFAIGFQVTDRAAQVMSDCASSPNHFYRVDDLDIDNAFDSIANQISALRLIQ